jgi:hypothetical protein
LMLPTEIQKMSVKFSMLYKNRMNKLLKEKSDARLKKAEEKGLLGEK